MPGSTTSIRRLLSTISRSEDEAAQKPSVRAHSTQPVARRRIGDVCSFCAGSAERKNIDALSVPNSSCVFWFFLEDPKILHSNIVQRNEELMFPLASQKSLATKCVCEPRVLRSCKEARLRAAWHTARPKRSN